MHKTDIGNKAEDQACKFIISQNAKIIKQNFKVLPYGEIDIIALDENTLAFIEVKYRKSSSFGTAQEMVSKAKQQKIINTANIFLDRHSHYQNYECRFDVIAINNNDIEWIKDAFIIM